MDYMLYIVSCVYPNDHQDLQGQNLPQLSPGRIPPHSQGASTTHPVLARKSGAGAPRALAEPGAPSSGELGRPALPDSCGCTHGNPGRKRAARRKTPSRGRPAQLAPRGAAGGRQRGCEHRSSPRSGRRSCWPPDVATDFSVLDDDALYRNLDRLHPHREVIERELAEREKSLFSLDDTLYLYDLTSTYFEGQVENNPQAKRGYSRDQRPDCKQVLVGLVLDGEGFPKAHEVFEGNRQDRSTVKEMLESLEKRTGKKAGGTVVVDRGMAYEENLPQIQASGHHYLVAGRQPERNAWLEEFENDDDWEEVIRTPSPRNPGQKKSQVRIKRRQKGNEVYILCSSEGREQKDRAIREKQEQRLQHDLQGLQTRVEKGHLKQTGKIYEAIGRLKERYPRVARYYRIEYDAQGKGFSWQEDIAKKAIAEKLDGGYVLKTDRQDMTADEIWRTYMLLTRVEAAFRAMKSPLRERPIFHHLQDRTQTHIFLCVLAYHLLVAIEKRFLDRDLHTSWSTLRQQLSTHQVITVVLPTTDGKILKIRRATAPEPIHREIYATLQIPMEVMKPVKTWHQTST